MTVLFNDSSVWRESNQWKAVFSPAIVDEKQSQLFSNFGSNLEAQESPTDFETVVQKVTEQFAMDVFSELKAFLMPDPTRSSRTSQGYRDSRKPLPPQRTPVVTPHNPKRASRYGGTSQGRDRTFPSI